MQQYSHINPELQDIRYMQQTPPMQYIDMKPDPIIGRPQQFLYTDYQQQDQNQYQQYYQQPVQYMEPPAKKMRPNPNITRQEDGEDDDDWGDGDSSEEDTKQKAPASRDDNLNSDDDLSDEEGDIPQTNHIVLSQFEKVTRTKNKWKCALKCGIMHLNGQDYVFNRASGEFDW
jgi:transcription initiation factor TFIIA large subunit